ncbi:MAG: SLC13 family permease, partial [Beijerinckiaceae bacterium]
AFGFMEIGALAFIGVGAMLLFRVIDTKEAWAALDMDTILLIYGMLIVGMTLQKTGAVSLVVDSLTPHLTGLHPLLVIFAIYLLCSVFTELISNSAVAIIMTPLALLLSQKLGMEPKVLVLTVMFGASASFATPIGYQTNTLVYKAGNYRFADFLKVGVPMNMIVGAATCLAIYLLFGK